MKHYDRVCAYVDLDAVKQNVEHIKANITPQTKVIAVVKADGYGHGAVPIAQALEPLDCLAGFAVATEEEALQLKKNGLLKPIIILGYTFPYAYEELIKEEVRLAVFRLDAAQQMSAIAGSLGMKAKVHIKVDTGMNRIGIMPDETGLDFVRQLTALPNLEIEGIFTHFARADEKNRKDAKEQFARFHSFVLEIEHRLGLRIPIKHCSNSAGIIDIKEANMDVVRAGIILYGLWPSDEVSRDTIALQPVLSLKSHIVYIKTVKEGMPISYGGTFVTEKTTEVATIPAGYGDGYPRGLSGRGYILLHGKKAPILGRVCMDQFMVDVTDIGDAAEGDEVTLIGSDHGARITLEEIADLSGGFNYELACNLGKRVPRAYLKGEKVVLTKDYFEEGI